MSGLRRTRRHAIASVALLGLALAGAGCAGGSHSKAGAKASGRVTVLEMAEAGSGTAPLEEYGAEVARLSGGSLRIRVRPKAYWGSPAAEQRIIHDVESGRAQLAWVMTRAFDRAGVPTFRALVAPFLIDSYPLQEKVLESPMAARMLAALRPFGLVGLGVFSGPLQRVLGVRRRLLRPGDFTGTRIGVQNSGVAAATIRALGGTAVPRPIDASLGRLDGSEQELGSIYGNAYFRGAKAVATNVALWPRSRVIIVNRKLFASLSPAKRAVLRRASAVVRPSYAPLSVTDDAGAVDVLCYAGLPLVTASSADVAALREAVSPVYRQLERDPQTRRDIRAIEAMRSGLPPAPQLRCPDRSAPMARTRSPIDGVYRVTTTAADLTAMGLPKSDIPGNYGKFTWVFDRGRFAGTQELRRSCFWAYGDLPVEGHTLELLYRDGGGASPGEPSSKPGEAFKYGWSLYREALTLAPVKGAISPEPLRVKAWQRISKTPSKRYFPGKCELPAKALTQ